MLIFDAFNVRQQQDFIALLAICEASGLTDLRFVRQRLQESVAAAVVQNKPTRQPWVGGKIITSKGVIVRANTICAKCGGQAVVERVNICGSTRIGGPWKSSISCLERNCRHVEYSRLAVDKVVAQ